MDIIFHYPPELSALLKDAIPKLCRSKPDLLLYFQSAGVDQKMLAPFQHSLRTNSAAFNKYHVTRDLLTKLNELGEKGLGERRALLRRVTETVDFSGCWENDRAAARGLVAQIRELVNVKDSFTRISIERDEERRTRLAEKETVRLSVDARKRKISDVQRQLFALFGEADAHKRGKALEAALNALFAAYGILVKEAFTVRGHVGEGVIEQIDGLIEFEGHLYLVELKWWNAPLGTADVSPHIVRVYGRGGQARGMFISYSGYTAPAITTCRDALAGGAVIILCELQEVVALLERQDDLAPWFKAKITAAIADRKPLHKQ